MCRRLHNIEQVNADLKDSALAHMPSSVCAVKTAWFVAAVMAYNLHPTPPGSSLPGPSARPVPERSAANPPTSGQDRRRARRIRIHPGGSVDQGLVQRTLDIQCSLLLKVTSRRSQASSRFLTLRARIREQAQDCLLSRPRPQRPRCQAWLGRGGIICPVCTRSGCLSVVPEAAILSAQAE